MTLYRALYAPHDGTLHTRPMTFAAADAEAAARIAADWQLPSDRLMTVKALRRLTEQFNLKGIRT